ncbi:hypothetical protein HBI95_151520 [Parastagonospora nodorum]|nr:hypothetical protein HBI95_151520 [Parastagonospora nodorum]
MARTAQRMGIRPTTTTKRPTPINPNAPGWGADLGHIYAEQLDADTVVLLPSEYYDEDDAELREDADAVWMDTLNADRCWKTTAVYEQIGEGHAHVVPFIRRDLWTACPVLEKPSGPCMEKFMQEAREVMYTHPLDSASSRVLPSHRPLIYQWALHFISGLSFIHSHEIILSDFGLLNCWLSADSHLSLSLVGFLDATFKWNVAYGRLYRGESLSGQSFHPLKYQREPSFQTDLFLYGCVVYELMTGAWPGDHSGLRGREITNLILSKRWPVLETEHMGEIVRKCWNGGFENAEQVKAEVIAFLEGLGWEIEGNDDLVGFDVADLEF